MHGNVAVRGANTAQDKDQNVANIPNHVTKEKGSQPASTSDSAQRKQQILIQQALPPVAPSNLLVCSVLPLILLHFLFKPRGPAVWWRVE